MPVFAPASDQAEVELPQPGRYVATCVAIEDAPDKGFGPGVKWVFKLSDPATGVPLQSNKGGDYELWQFTSLKMTPKAKARPIIEALMGRPLSKGEVPDDRFLLGRSMSTVVIYEKRDDGTDKAVVSTCQPYSSNGAAVTQPMPTGPAPAPSNKNAGGGLLDQVNGAIRKAHVLTTPRHLEWLALDVTRMSDGDLYQTLGDINADIASS